MRKDCRRRSKGTEYGGMGAEYGATGSLKDARVRWPGVLRTSWPIYCGSKVFLSGSPVNFYCLPLYDLPSKVMNLPFMLSLSSIADAVTVSNTFPH